MRAVGYDLIARLEGSSGQDSSPFGVEDFHVPLLDAPDPRALLVANYRKT